MLSHTLRSCRRIGLLQSMLVACLLLGFAASSHADKVAHWPLDSGEGEVFENVVDPTFDGYLLDETVQVNWVPVELNGDGTGPSQDFAVELINDNQTAPTVQSFIQTDFPGIGGNTPRTITCWIRAEPTGWVWNEFLGYGVPANGEKWHLRLNGSAGNGVLSAVRTEYQGGQNVGTTPLDDGLWHHVAAVFPEGATMGQEILHYVDGVLEGKSGGDFAINTNISNPIFNVTIGMTRQNDTTSLRFGRGLIADVRMYDEAVSETGILAIMEGDEPPPPTPCSEMTAVCSLVEEANSVTATLVLEPEGCACGTVSVSVGERDLGLRPVLPGGVVELRVDDVCELAAGEEVDVTVTCSDTEVSAVCSVSCPESRGLVAHWPLDEGEGTTFTNLADATYGGYLLDGTVVVNWAPVERNDDGTGPAQDFAVELINDAAATPTTPSFIQTDYPGIGGHHPRTIAFWMKAARTGANEFVGYGVVSNGLKWHTRLNAGAADGAVGAVRTEYQGGRVVGTTLIDDGRWHHVTAVFPEGATTGAEIVHYVDGVREGQSIGDFAIDTDISDPVFNVTLGMTRQNATTDMRFGNGLLADVRIYDRGLDESEILELVTGEECYARRSLSAAGYLPGGTVAVSLKVLNIAGASTLTESIPAGWTVSDNPDGGAVGADSITFDLSGDADLSYELSVPGDFCGDVALTGVLSGDGGCSAEVVGDSMLACVGGCGDLDVLSGGVTSMLIIGPIDAGRLVDGSGVCDNLDPVDGSTFDAHDYLNDDLGTSESTLSVVFGDEIAPDFGGEASGVGVAASPNLQINPRAAEGILTVWHAEADTEGYIDLDAAGNIGAVNDHITYGLVYLENTTEDALPVVLEVGSDDAVKVLVNGQLVFANGGCRGMPAYGSGDRIALDGTANPALEPGVNTVLIAVVERSGGNGVRLVVRDELDAPLVDGSVIACLTPDGGTTLVEICDNGVDDDEDGDVDCDDSDCVDAANCQGTSFVRGDADASGEINITDGIYVLNFLFLGGPDPICKDAADPDDSGAINITDGIYVLNFLFLGGPGPLAPHPACGEDPGGDDDGLDCASFPECE